MRAYTACDVAGWESYETPTVMSGLVVRWQRVGERDVPRPFQISASRAGVMVSGYDHVAMTSVEDVKAVLDLAHARHLSLSGGVA